MKLSRIQIILLYFPAEINTNLNQILQEEKLGNPTDYLTSDPESDQKPFKDKFLTLKRRTCWQYGKLF